MKKYLLLLALIPIFAYAGNSKSHDVGRNPWSPGGHSSVPSVPIILPTTPVAPIIVPGAPGAPTSPPNPGGGQIYCSGPTAPGWNVGVKDGGCKPPVIVPLTAIPYTGLSFWQWIVELFIW